MPKPVLIRVRLSLHGRADIKSVYHKMVQYMMMKTSIQENTKHNKKFIANKKHPRNFHFSKTEKLKNWSPDGVEVTIDEKKFISYTFSIEKN